MCLSFSFQLCDCQTLDTLASENGGITSFFNTFHIATAWHFVGLDSMVDSGMCYGFCIMSFSITLAFALLFQQVLRAFSAPSIVRHTVNAAAFVLLYSRSNLYLLTDRIFLALCVTMTSLFAIVQWNFLKSRSAVSESNLSLNSCLDRMDRLHLQLSLFRYLAVAIYCSTALLQEQPNY
jgi:hypothetical protein